MLLTALLFGCRSQPPKEDPAKTFEDIRGDFLHGNLDLAQLEAKQAEERFSTPDANWAMKFRVLEAEVLTYQGRRPDVIALLQDEHVSYPETGDMAIERNLLCALAHARLGQSQRSDVELQEAGRLSQLSNSRLDGEVLRAQAQIQVFNGHLDEAANLFRKSQLAAREHGDLFLEASDLLNLGWVSLQMEHYDEAVASLKKAADFAKSANALQVVEAAFGDLGYAYFSLGDFEKALSTFQQAEQESKAIGTTSARVDWLLDAGASDYKLGRMDEAKAYYEESLKAAETISDSDAVAGTHTYLAMLFLQERQFDLARKHCGEALRAARSSEDKSAELDPLYVQALISIRSADGQDEEPKLLQLYDRTAGVSPLRGDIEDALANLYAANHKSREAEVWYRKSIQTFESQRSSLKDDELKLPFFSNGDALYRDYVDYLISSNRQNEALAIYDVGRARTLAEGLKTKKSSSTAIRERVNPQAVARRLNATILFYALGPERSYLWAVTSNQIRLFPLPKRQEIESRVQSYQRAILKSSDALRDANTDGRYLYNTIVSPAASMIPPGAKVFIIPDGGLNGLNFETLLKPEGGSFHYWIEDVTLTNADSIGLLSRLSQSSPNETRNLLVLGNPVSAVPGFESLPNASAEVDDIKRHFAPDRETVLTQGAAIPSAYAASQPDRFTYIHFVAHGTASRLSPLDSAVVLSPSAGHPEDYKLYAREIVRHPLHAQLVTISSCYGSGLRAYAGEELVGLSWAFLRAGAHNVIGALWEVNDSSAPQLMDRLYGGLAAGSQPDAALREAKLAMLHSEGVTRKPLYWAAFQLYAGS